MPCNFMTMIKLGWGLGTPNPSRAFHTSGFLPLPQCSRGKDQERSKGTWSTLSFNNMITILVTIATVH